ncbi:hypothetical protein GYMLUDRAFT_915053 [Collybiopsis luxurians FD-317 M1]|nr:hypothetical protein GYMLUDRAFT_915053 [Collybiopsis luxurians FD-317 M1]
MINRERETVVTLPTECGAVWVMVAWGLGFDLSAEVVCFCIAGTPSSLVVEPFPDVESSPTSLAPIPKSTPTLDAPHSPQPLCSNSTPSRIFARPNSTIVINHPCRNHRKPYNNSMGSSPSNIHSVMSLGWDMN